MPKRATRHKRRQTERRAHQPVGAVRKRSEPCGLCGQTGGLTKTHLPPQCAGNTDAVTRRRIVTDSSGRAVPSRATAGGLHFYGLCPACNGLASKYDDAYCELVAILRPNWIRGTAALPGLRYRTPAVMFRPGAVARSVLIGMFGLSPTMRTLYPETAEALLAEETKVPVPDAVRLRVAMSRGRRARISGAVGRFHVLGDGPGGARGAITTMAEVYFPPLAWQLAASDAEQSTLLDLEGWPDASFWLDSAADERLPLDAVCPSMPSVLHPVHDPLTGDGWVELFSDEITAILDSEDVTPTGE